MLVQKLKDVHYLQFYVQRAKQSGKK